MASVPLEQVSASPRIAPASASALLSVVRENGSASHPYTTSEKLLCGPHAQRNLADAVHLLCGLHGRYPSLVELVASRNIEPAARAWLAEASEVLARERTYLARLTVEAGPVPSTPGAGSEAAVAMQRNALTTLAVSERRGCPLGAAFALVLDWAVVRNVLDAAAQRFGRTVPHPFPDQAAQIAEAAEALSSEPSVARAMRFGAEQVALQHRGLWDLLRARAEARGS
jgi:hypothetical protein